jgi:hypothetical protein
MPPGQAFGIAIVIVLAVFGSLYLVWRSRRTGSYLRIVIGTSFASMFAACGTLFLLYAEPNILIALGGAIAFYTWAFKHGFMAWHDYQRQSPSHASLKTMFRFYFGGHLVAGCVFGIGCLLYGGGVGVLGAALSAWWGLFHFWVLKRVTHEAGDAGRLTSADPL